MINEAELLFQVGSIMLLAFIAATLAGKRNQSVMIGYIIIGAFIGPKMSLQILGVEYHGLITDTTFIELLSYGASVRMERGGDQSQLQLEHLEGRRPGHFA